MKQYTKFVGLDVHKKTIAVAVCDSQNPEVRYYGESPNTIEALRRLTQKLSEEGAELHFVYEAGPCGYGVHRRLLTEGHRCQVVAPSLIPKKAGDRVKTDRRDAQALARLHRAGELTPVWNPRERTGSDAGPVPSAGGSEVGRTSPQAASFGLFPAPRGGSPGREDAMERSLHDLA